jgi:hypothetical protein
MTCVVPPRRGSENRVRERGREQPPTRKPGNRVTCGGSPPTSPQARESRSDFGGSGMQAVQRRVRKRVGRELSRQGMPACGEEEMDANLRCVQAPRISLSKVFQRHRDIRTGVALARIPAQLLLLTGQLDSLQNAAGVPDGDSRPSCRGPRKEASWPNELDGWDIATVAGVDGTMEERRGALGHWANKAVGASSHRTRFGRGTTGHFDVLAALLQLGKGLGSLHVARCS